MAVIIDQQIVYSCISPKKPLRARSRHDSDLVQKISDSRQLGLASLWQVGYQRLIVKELSPYVISPFGYIPHRHQTVGYPLLIDDSNH